MSVKFVMFVRKMLTNVFRCDTIKSEKKKSDDNVYSGYGVAKTEPLSASFTSADARIRFYGSAEVWPWAYGSWEIEDGRCVAVQYTADLDGLYMAESFHQIDIVTTYLTAEYY